MTKPLPESAEALQAQPDIPEVLKGYIQARQQLIAQAAQIATLTAENKELRERLRNAE